MPDGIPDRVHQENGTHEDGEAPRAMGRRDKHKASHDHDRHASKHDLDVVEVPTEDAHGQQRHNTDGAERSEHGASLGAGEIEVRHGVLGTERLEACDRALGAHVQKKASVDEHVVGAGETDLAAPLRRRPLAVGFVFSTRKSGLFVRTVKALFHACFREEKILIKRRGLGKEGGYYYWLPEQSAEFLLFRGWSPRYSCPHRLQNSLPGRGCASETLHISRPFPTMSGKSMRKYGNWTVAMHVVPLP